MTRTRIQLIAAVFCVALGLAIGWPVFFGTKPQRGAMADGPLAAAPTTVNLANADQQVSGKPVRIKIPSLGINLPVVDGYYDAKKQDWTLNEDKAQFATLSYPANTQLGNTFIYGHNNGNVFEKLPRVKPGSVAYVSTNNNHVFMYTFRSAYDTPPSNQELFGYKGSPRLVLQTCTGVWSQNRTLFSFELVRVQ